MTGMAERTGYLPGLNNEIIDWHTLAFERDNQVLKLAVPVLNETQLQELISTVQKASRTVLKALTVHEITGIIDAAITRLLNRNDPYRKKAETLLPVITGYDDEMIKLGLTDYLKTFRQTDLQKFLAEDFTNPTILDQFQPIPKGGLAKAIGPDLLLHIWAGNVPGLPLWSLVSGLLVKAGNIGKVPSGEPLFANLFAELLAEVEPKLSDCFAIIWWQGGDDLHEQILLDRADVVLAYGSNTSLSAIRARTPLTTRFIGHGHKISFGLVSKESLYTQKAWATAHQAAFDIIRYDQQGCYSPQVLFVERGGSVAPPEFAKLVANELRCFEQKFPRRELTIEEAGEIAAWRHAEESRITSKVNRDMMGDPLGTWSVVFTEEAEDLSPSSLNRTVKIITVDALDEAITRITPFKRYLQTVGIAASPNELYRLSELLGAVGVTRICALGHMTAPEAGWHHDGRFNLLDLVTLTEIERSAETSAEALAPYVD